MSDVKNHTVCEKDMCSGCGACVSKCNKNAVHIDDSIDSYNAIIDSTKCVDCGLCRDVCPICNPPELLAQNTCYQGWARNNEIRMNSSSGGVASAMIEGFVKAGGYACACVFCDGRFIFRCSNNPDSYIEYRGSKYVKSNPVSAFKDVLNYLNTGNRVLFIGLPCQVAAMKNYIPLKLHEGLFTIDLICHGAPSPKCLEFYLNERKLTLRELNTISFRIKHNFSIITAQSNKRYSRVADSYTISFLQGLNYTNNCYHCLFATIDRCSDVTLGDSWGSQLSSAEKEMGVSLILAQTKKGQELISMSDLVLLPVNMEIVLKNNQQLTRASLEPRGRKWFLKMIMDKRLPYRVAVFRLYPILVLKQMVKYVLIKTSLLKN